MAIGDTANINARLAKLLPSSWFSRSSNPILGAVTGAISDTFAQTYALIQFSKLQTRISTATGGFLDLIGLDYFGLRVQRKASQTDASWAKSIKAEIVRPRQTRASIVKAVNDLTNTPVTIFEPWNAGDTGGFGAAFAFGETAAAWGSTAYPYTVFVTAVEPVGAGIPSLSGFNNTWGGFGAGAFAFADLSRVQGNVTNQNIYDAIEATRAAGVTAWVNIAPPPIAGGRLDINFNLDSTLLS